MVSLVSALLSSDIKSCMKLLTNTVGLFTPVLRLSHMGFVKRGAENRSISHCDVVCQVLIISCGWKRNFF